MVARSPGSFATNYLEPPLAANMLNCRRYGLLSTVSPGLFGLIESGRLKTIDSV